MTRIKKRYHFDPNITHAQLDHTIKLNKKQIVNKESHETLIKGKNKDPLFGRKSTTQERVINQVIHNISGVDKSVSEIGKYLVFLRKLS
ncbi:hypothetical protein AUQ44_10010 [Vibrio cidicii]|uniref:Uncharacterized protein n=1 Tax=Vibrio cidicii TaxID=1763883 RepID=A0A151JIW1_9VIBR|nr:hypothetical protein AUQ44_10010 [Vibrio cidicii]